MKYLNITTLQLEEKNGLDIMDLIGVHDLMNDSKDSVAEEIMKRLKKGEVLPPMAFNIVFEHIGYFQKNQRRYCNYSTTNDCRKRKQVTKIKSI